MIKLIDVSKRFIIPDKRSSTLFGSIANGIKRKNTHKTIWALDRINIEIKRGEAIGVIGPNGSGKTTLLRIISGIYKPTSGIVNVAGEVTSVLQLRIGFLPDLSLKENVFLFGTIMGMDRKDISKKFSRIVDFAELNEFVNAEVRTMSLGMKERLAFSIITEACKDILLLDETLAVGDERFKEKCFEIMNRFHRIIY